RFYQDHIACNGIRISELRQRPAHEYFGYLSLRGFKYHNKIRLSLTEQMAGQTLNVVGTISPLGKRNKGLDVASKIIHRARVSSEEITAGEALQAACYVPEIIARRMSVRLRGEGPLWKQTMLSVHCEQSPLSRSMVGLSDERDELGM